MITVEDVLKSIEGEPAFRPLRNQLERFSLGTPIRGATSEVTFDDQFDYTAKMKDGEVVITGKPKG